MARDYDQQYQDTRERIMRHRHPGTYEISNGREEHFPGYQDPEDGERMLSMADAYDADNFTVDPPSGQQTKSRTTLKNYLTGLKKVAVHVELTNTTTDELNVLMQAFRDGGVDNVKDGGITNGSVRVYQNALRQFYYVYDDIGVDPGDIALASTDQSTVDPAEMLTREEIQAIREAAECLRDTALFDFLLYTGQRNTATRSLRIKDLDLKNSRFRLNAEATGLKNAEKNGKWRDMLLSGATVRQYLNTEHPAPDDPEAYVFVGRPKYGGPDPFTMLDVTTVGAIIGRLADRAAEEVPSIASKPTYPHALRHNFVTIALRRDMHEQTIKHQIGHGPESTVMETTYAHLKDSDHIREARDAFDLETEPAESELTPEVCPQCGENPPENARMCPWCGLGYTPDAKEFVESVEDTVHDSYRAVDIQRDDAELLSTVQVVDDLLDDPAFRQFILDHKNELEKSR